MANVTLDITGDAMFGSDVTLNANLGPPRITGTMLVGGRLTLNTGNGVLADLNEFHANGGFTAPWMNSPTVHSGNHFEVNNFDAIFNEKKEPALDMSNIRNNPLITRLNRNDINNPGWAPGLDVNRFKDAVAAVPPARRWNGTHVVVELCDQDLNMMNNDWTFDDNVIFILCGSTRLEGKMYSNVEPDPDAAPPVPGSSTLIYVEDRSRLHDLRFVDLFRGLIHVSEDNKESQVIESLNADFRGSIQTLGDGQLRINSHNAPFRITHDPDVLEPFSGLIAKNDGGVVFNNEERSINFATFGFYFY
jgi:hypothetical protein